LAALAGACTTERELAISPGSVPVASDDEAKQLVYFFDRATRHLYIADEPELLRLIETGEAPEIGWQQGEAVAEIGGEITRGPPVSANVSVIDALEIKAKLAKVGDARRLRYLRQRITVPERSGPCGRFHVAISQDGGWTWRQSDSQFQTLRSHDYLQGAGQETATEYVENVQRSYWYAAPGCAGAPFTINDGRALWVVSTGGFPPPP
jgi:hypothetical protein